jgi:long-chain fatty acid transport protein
VHADIGPANTGLTAGADSAATAYFNPAGMTRLEQTEIVVNPVLAYSWNTIETRDGSTFGSGERIEDNGLVAVPGIYIAKPMKDRFAIGVGINVPSGIGTDYGEDWPGRYIAQESSLVYVAVSPAAAYRVSKPFSLGFGLSVIYSEAVSKAAINNAPEGRRDGEIEIETSGVGIGVNLAALFEVSDRTRLGLVYRSESEPELDGVPQFKNLGPVRAGVLLQNDALGREVTVSEKTPQVLQAGLHHDFDNDWTLSTELWWIDFSDFGFESVSVGPNSISVPSSYDDMWLGSLGIEFPVADKWRLAFGAMHLTSGMDDEERTISLPLDRVWSVGAGFRRALEDGRRLRVNVNYIDAGEAPVDQETSPLSGRLVSAFTTNETLMVDVSVSFRFGMGSR